MGRAVFTAEDAVEASKKSPVILIRKETTPDDIHGMEVAKGILTAVGGKSSHAAVVARCAAAGQTRPTPLLLRYGPSDHNCLHQDLYGEIHFPLQAILLLDRPGIDFDGGELILVEQRPRRQSTPIVLPLAQGAFAVIPVKERPVESLRGAARVQVRHGVSKVRRGLRRTLGLIFHDAA